MKISNIGFLMFLIAVLFIIPEQSFGRSPWPREGQTISVSKLFINEFNNTYNLKNKKLVFKAHASDSGFSGLNLDAKAHGVRIVCMTHNFTMGIMFYDKIDNMKLYSAKRYSIYKLPEFRNGEQLIAVFYLRCPDRLINEILKKNSLSKIFTCIQIRQNKEIYYLLKPFLKHIEY